LIAGERIGLALSVQLKELLSLRRHEDTSHLLRGRPQARDLDGVLEVGVVDEITLFLLQPPEALCVVTGDLLLLAPLRRLFRRLSFCVFYVRFVPLVEP
jgi:hypothetical protein